MNLNSFLKSNSQKAYLAYQIFANDMGTVTIESVGHTLYTVPTLNHLKFYVSSISLRDQLDNVSTYSGPDISFFMSLKKCFSELCEGYYIKNFCNELEHRSGIAAHPTKSESEKNAYRELIERDSFIMHFLCPELSSEILVHKSDSNEEVTTVELQSIDPTISVMMSVIYCKQTQLFYIGLASGINDSKSKAKLVEKSLFEATMIYYSFSIPRFSTYQLRSEKTSIFLQHLNSSKDSHALKKIIKGGESVELKTKVDPLYQQINRHRFKTRFVTQAKLINGLEINFGDAWLDSFESLKKIMSDRHLPITNWGLHPLV